MPESKRFALVQCCAAAYVARDWRAPERLARIARAQRFTTTEAAIREYVAAQWGTWDAEAQRAAHEKSLDTTTFHVLLVSSANSRSASMSSNA